MKSHRRHHSKNIYGKSTLRAWCQHIHEDLRDQTPYVAPVVYSA